MRLLLALAVAALAGCEDLPPPTTPPPSGAPPPITTSSSPTPTPARGFLLRLTWAEPTPEWQRAVAEAAGYWNMHLRPPPFAFGPGPGEVAVLYVADQLRTSTGAVAWGLARCPCVGSPPEAAWFSRAVPERFRVVVALHELGHLLGLGHVNDPGQIMNPYTHNTSALSPLDIARAQALLDARNRP